jgi:hypothetical protein
MNKKIKLSESDLMRIVKRVVNEQSFDESNDYEKKYDGLVSQLRNIIFDLEKISEEFNQLGRQVSSELESFEDDDNFEFDESKDYLGEIASACYYYDDKINDFMRELD